MNSGAAAAIAALSVWAVLHAARFLEVPASPPAPADLLAALGGDHGDRGLAAARLYAAGMAPRVLVTGLEASPPEVRRAYLHWRAQVLAAAGVPLERFEYDAASGNSWEEAVNTRRLMEARGWRRVLVVSDPYHMRRLSWTWRRVFEGGGLESTNSWEEAVNTRRIMKANGWDRAQALHGVAHSSGTAKAGAVGE